MFAANEESGDPPGLVKALSDQASPPVPPPRDKPSIPPHPGMVFLRNQNSRAAISHMVGDPAVFWQDVVSEYLKSFYV